MHYYKFNIPDWSLGAGHLSLVEEAIYFRLVNFYYDSESPIPLDFAPVLRKLRMLDQIDIAAQILEEFFVKTEKGFTHKRCEKLLKEYRKTSKNNRENGAKGGRPKKYAASNETHEEPSGLFSQTQSEPTHNPNQELLTNNYKPITNNHLKDKDIVSPAAQREPETFDHTWEGEYQEPVKPKKTKVDDFDAKTLGKFMPPDLEQAWLTWIDYRKQRKFKTVEKTWMTQAKKLADWGKAGHDPVKIIEQSIGNGWQGLFELKTNFNGGNNGTYQQRPKESAVQRCERQAREIFADASAEEAHQRSVGANGADLR